MSLQSEAKELVKYTIHQKETLEHNKILFNIHEGNLMPYIMEDLKAQLNPKSYEIARLRIVPINVLKRIIDKLSKIYAKAPLRTINKGVEKDKELLDYYSESMNPNVVMSIANAMFNLCKNTFIEPFMDNGAPKLRVLPSHMFTVFSENSTNPLRPSHLVKIMREFKRMDGVTDTLYYLYTDKEFLAVNKEGEPVLEIMNRPDVQSMVEQTHSVQSQAYISTDPNLS